MENGKQEDSLMRRIRRLQNILNGDESEITEMTPEDKADMKNKHDVSLAILQNRTN